MFVRISVLRNMQLYLKGFRLEFSLWKFSGIFQNTSCCVLDFAYFLSSKIFPPRRLLLRLPITKAYLGQSIQEWTEKNFLKAVFHKFYFVHS